MRQTRREPRPQQQEVDWAVLMRAAQAGDARRYEQLLRAVAPFVRNHVRRYSRDPHLADDVVQDVLMTLHRVRHTWNPQRLFTPWLAAIAGRRAIDRIRREIRIARHEVSVDEAPEALADPPANHVLGAQCSAETLEPFLAALSQRQRFALEAVRIRGLSMAKAASESGQSVVAMRVSVHRAMKALRKLIGCLPGPVEDRDL